MFSQIFTKNNHNASKHGSGKDRLGTFGSSDFSHLTSHGGTTVMSLMPIAGYTTLVLRDVLCHIISHFFHASPNSSAEFHVVSLISDKL